MAGLLPCFILLVLAFCHTWIAEGMKDESFQWVRSGESVTIHCSSAEPGFDGLYLLLGLHDEKEVFFFHKENKKLNMGHDYKNRVQTQGELDKLTITIGNMTDDDSGVYWCKYRYFNPDEGQALKKTGIGSTLVVVNGKPCPPVEGTVLTKNLVIVTAISAVSVSCCVSRCSTFG
ncbi:hypothetical protein AGOR_G00098380 [Albula goreensis]|uniref:Ig-like domain-containing protein n=1 Tax=Albula goreensis TaxID=1534307 RepID=A0A8T3DLQ8_9TELE|nr:hypothetical protein AGOR_G00098380 [Albula goreensis]